MTLIETLQMMKNTLLENGWCQGDFRDNKGQMCLIGSYTRSGLSLKPGVVSFEAVVDALYKGPAVNGGSLMSFNDAPDRTFNEIVGAIDDAILRVKEKEADSDVS